VQVGAFGSSDAARKVVAELERNGYHAYVAPLNRSGKTLYRVRVGPVAAKPDAEKLASRLKASGKSGTVVAAE
jgi:DedD protein